MVVLPRLRMSAWFLSICLTSYTVTSQEGTHLQLEQIFKGRCWDYTLKINDILPKVNVNCVDLWSNFASAFTYADACSVTSDKYTPFLSLARQTLPRDKVLFWSGVYGLAQKFSEKAKRYVTLEDTFIGYLADTLVWCGQSGNPGVNYTGCPVWGSCPGEARFIFWRAASKVFAQEAKGHVIVMLAGSTPGRPAYRRDSIFADTELPSLNVSAVTKVQVYLIHDLDKPKIETCATGSLLELKKDVQARGLMFECIDDPAAVMHILCSTNPGSKHCQICEFNTAGFVQSHLISLVAMIVIGLTTVSQFSSQA